MRFDRIKCWIGLHAWKSHEARNLVEGGYTSYDHTGDVVTEEPIDACDLVEKCDRCGEERTIHGPVEFVDRLGIEKAWEDSMGWDTGPNVPTTSDVYPTDERGKHGPSHEYYAVIDTDLREMNGYDGPCIISIDGQAAIYKDEEIAHDTRDSIASKQGEHFVVEEIPIEQLGERVTRDDDQDDDMELSEQDIADMLDGEEEKIEEIDGINQEKYDL